jgi:hypothetical protein
MFRFFQSDLWKHQRHSSIFRYYLDFFQKTNTKFWKSRSAFLTSKLRVHPTRIVMYWARIPIPNFQVLKKLDETHPSDQRRWKRDENDDDIGKNTFRLPFPEQRKRLCSQPSTIVTGRLLRPPSQDINWWKGFEPIEDHQCRQNETTENGPTRSAYPSFSECDQSRGWRVYEKDRKFH